MRERQKKINDLKQKTIASVNFDTAVLLELRRMVPEEQRSAFVNQCVREKLFDQVAYAKLQKRFFAQQCNYWDYELNRLETDKTLRDTGLLSKQWES